MNCTIRLQTYIGAPQHVRISGRIPGCQSTNHTECYGELWTCENCGKIVCFAEGTDNHPELCDDCWVERYAQEYENTRKGKEMDMKTAPQLKRLIEQIAHKHAFGFDQTGAYLRLDLREDRLIIENIGANRISIAYQLFLLEKWTSDPEIVVWTDYKPTGLFDAEEPTSQWVPIELYEFKDGWKACAEIDPNGNLVAFYRHEWQAWLAEYTETVVIPNLISQSWLEQGVKSDDLPPSYTLEQMRERGYLIEETYPNEVEVDDDIPF